MSDQRQIHVAAPTPRGPDATALRVADREGRKAREKTAQGGARFTLDKAVGTADFTDDSDEEDAALEGAFTRRVTAEKPPALRESGYHPCDPVIRGFSLFLLGATVMIVRGTMSGLTLAATRFTGGTRSADLESAVSRIFNPLRV
ncbi:MAG: hypothetical protein ACYDH9_24775, partial [Limisphaerales bacterium]